MSHILIVDADAEYKEHVERAVRSAGHDPFSATSEPDALRIITTRLIQIVILDLALQDRFRLDKLRYARNAANAHPSFIVAGHATVCNVLKAMRFGAIDFIEKPIVDHDLLECINRAAIGEAIAHECKDSSHPLGGAELQAYAARRWADAVVRVVDCTTDPRTVGAWGRWMGASPGAIRNWCRTAGIGPRRSLVFGRMLRAFMLSRGTSHKFENLLDVVDRRTLAGLLALAGLQVDPLPEDIQGFLDRQILVRDPVALEQVERVIRRWVDHRAA